MSRDHTLYCDEAGHTGPNYVNASQPVFVEAGYLVADDEADAVRDVVREHLATYNARAQRPLTELKSQVLMRGGRNRLLAAELLAALSAVGAVPIISAFDKHFALGARFVDDFLDFETNPRAPTALTYDHSTKRRAATVVGQLSPSVLAAIEVAIREPARRTRRNAVKAVRRALRDRGAFNFAAVVEGALLDPDHLEPAAGGEHAWPDPVQALTPNVAGFVAVVVGADQYAVARGIPTVRIVHDEATNAADVLHGHYLVSDPDAYAHLAPHGLMPPRVTRAACRPVFVPSHLEPIVQAADVLAGAVADWARTGILADREGRVARFDRAALQMAAHTLDAFLSERVPGGGMVFSDDDHWLFALAEQAGGAELRERLRAHRGHPPGYPDADDLFGL